MPIALERPQGQADAAPRGGKSRAPTRRTAAGQLSIPVALGTGAVLLHALDSWVLQVEGDSSPGRRAMYLVSVILGGILWLIAHRVLSKRLQAMALMSAGLISAVIVAPVLGSYIDKQGLGGSRLSGVLGLVGAIALITIGATRLVRDAKTRWRKLLAIPIAFAIAQFLVLPVVPAVLATQAARPPLPGGTPADLGMSYENVAIEAADGTKLAAWYIESRNGAAILLRHGSGSTRASLLRHAAFLSGAGYGVLLTDARGHGNSGGRINEFGWHGRQDIPAALDYLEARPDVSGDIGILGLSMGGEEALVAAAGDERIAAVVAEGAGTSTYEDSIAKEAHPMARYINWTMYALTDVLSDASQPAGITDSIRLIAPRPVLLIAGEETVEKTVGPIYRDAGGPTTQLWMLPDTPHTGGLRHHPPDYKERVLSFFHGSLLHE